MYICSCHAVTDGAMRALIRSGQVKTFAQMAKTTGLATQCGICGRQAKELFYKILNEERAAGNISEQADHTTAETASADSAPQAGARTRPISARNRGDSAILRARAWNRAAASKGAARNAGCEDSVATDSDSCARICASCTCSGCPALNASREDEG